MSDPHSNRPATRVARAGAWRRCCGAGALALLAAGCNVPGARIHNLKELHEDTGRHARSGNLVGAFEYYVLIGAGDLFGDRLANPGEGNSETFSNPLKSCLGNINALSRIETDDRRVTAAQVAMLSWLAIDDPWKLSREAAVRALGDHGARLGVTVPPPRQVEPVGVDEVRRALTELVSAVRTSGPLVPVELPPAESSPAEPSPAGPSPAGPSKGKRGAERPLAVTAQLDAACARIEGLDLDRAGALRLLRGVGALATALPQSDARNRRLLVTLEGLQARCVSESLLAALKDSAPRNLGTGASGWGSERVRAAAVTACVKAFGDDALGELLLQLNDERADAVVRAILVAVAKRGFPEPPAAVSEQERPLWIQRWTDLILLHAYDSPSGPVRVAAMRALSRISGGELDSLREEDWQAWRRERGTAAALEANVAGQEPEPRAREPRN